MAKKNSVPAVKSNSFFETFHSLEDKIRKRAYEIFNTRNADEGDSLSDWMQARSEVLTAIALDFKDEEDRYVLTGEVPEGFFL